LKEFLISAFRLNVFYCNLCETVIQSPLYGVHTAVAWEMQVSAYSLATHFEHYHTTLRMSFNE